jgi:hypothetical protein
MGAPADVTLGITAAKSAPAGPTVDVYVMGAPDDHWPMRFEQVPRIGESLVLRYHARR